MRGTAFSQFGARERWVRPQLVVLTRPSSGERVLDVCKNNEFFMNEPAIKNNYCWTEDEYENCVVCNVFTDT